jgi:hypothetical protein
MTTAMRRTRSAYIAAMRWWPLLLVSCLPPKHSHVAAPEPEAPARPSREGIPAIHVGVFDPTGSGNWLNTITFSPAPASVIAPCLEPGSAGSLWVAFDSHDNEASTTEVAEATLVPEKTRACITSVLARVHAPAQKMMLYVSFGPELSVSPPAGSERQ